MRGFREANDVEKELALTWLRRERKSNTVFPLVCVGLVVVAFVAFLIVSIPDYKMMPIACVIGLLLIPSIFFCAKSIATENEKVRRVEEDKALIADALILDITYKKAGRAYIDVVEIEFKNDKLVRKSVVVSKKIRKNLKKGSQGYVIVYPDCDNRWLKDQLVLIPSSS